MQAPEQKASKNTQQQEEPSRQDADNLRKMQARAAKQHMNKQSGNTSKQEAAQTEQTADTQKKVAQKCQDDALRAPTKEVKLDFNRKFTLCAVQMHMLKNNSNRLFTDQYKAYLWNMLAVSSKPLADSIFLIAHALPAIIRPSFYILWTLICLNDWA